MKSLYIQHNDEKPREIKLANAEQEIRASDFVKNGKMTIKGVEYRVIGTYPQGTMLNMDVLWQKDEALNKNVMENFEKPTTNYDEFRRRSANFKKTGKWE